MSVTRPGIEDAPNNSAILDKASCNKKNDFLVDALHIFVLFSFALAQPLFDVLSRHVQFFVAHGSKPVDVILLVVIVCILLPTIAVLIESVAGLFGRGIRKGMHGLVVACLMAGIALPVLKQMGGVSGATLLTGAGMLGMVVAISYLRFHPVRNVLTLLSLALLLFPGLFLFHTPVSKVVFRGGDSITIYPKVDATTPVIMVVFDEFHITSLMDEHRQIDPIRYPNFAALARDATWFRNATSVAEGTEYAVPPILTGNYPDRRLPTAADHPHNLFTLLGGTYNLKVFETITQLCPDQLCESNASHVSFSERMESLLSDVSIIYLHILLPPSFTTGLPPIEGTWKDFAARGNGTEKDIKVKAGKWEKKDQASLFETYIESIYYTQQPTLFFLHVQLPHVPWKYLPSGKRYGPVDLSLLPHGVVRDTWSDDEWETVQGFQRYLLQVGFTDKLLGKLIARLRAVNLYDRSVIVITADHGVSFRPTDSRRPLTGSNYQDILPVPLFIKVPGQHKAVVSDRNVETIDILPTIADILGIRLPWPIDGCSALDLSAPTRMEKIAFNDSFERFEFDSALEAKYVSLERMLSLFGSGTKPDGLFRIGPHNELFGSRVSDVSMVQASNHIVEMDWPTAFENVDPEAAFVPAHITGRVFLREDAGPLNLAVAVNGVIRAVTRTYREGQAWKFAAMIPDTAFRPGKNDVDVFVVSEEAGKLKVHRTKYQSALTYSLTSPTGERGEAILASNGTFIRVIPGALQGYLDVVVVENNYARFRGWAADAKNFQLPEAVLIFVDGEFLYSGRTSAERLDVAKFFGNAELLMAGFDYTFHLKSFRNTANAKVRFFGVSKNGVASELNYPQGNGLAENHRKL
jgi:sulfatase-like protein